MTDGDQESDHLPTDESPAENLYPTPFGLNISFPEVIKIRMVDASALADYEVLIIFTGLFCNISCGFGVTLATSENPSKLLVVITILFSLLTIGFLVWALMKRRSMTRRAKEFKVKTSSVEEVKE